jgi:hypothetical protein
MASRHTSVQKSLIGSKDYSLRSSIEPCNSLEQDLRRRASIVRSPDLRKRVSWGNQKIRTYLRDHRASSDQEHYNLIEPGEAEQPISSQDQSIFEAMSIDNEFTMKSAGRRSSRSKHSRGFDLQDLYGGYSSVSPVVRMNCEESPMDELTVNHDRGLAGRYVRQLEETPVQSRHGNELTPVHQETQPFNLISSDDTMSLPLNTPRLPSEALGFSAFQFDNDPREPLQELSAQFAGLHVPKILKTCLPDVRRESLGSFRLSRPETPRKSVTSRVVGRQSSYQIELKEPDSPTSIYDTELRTKIKLLVPKLKRHLTQRHRANEPTTPSTPVLSKPVEYEEKTRLMCEELHREIQDHQQFTQSLQSETSQLQEQISTLTAEVAAMEATQSLAEQELKHTESVMAGRCFRYFMRELELLKEMAGWELMSEAEGSKHYRRAWTRLNRHIYARYSLDVICVPSTSAVLSYSSSDDFESSVLAVVFPSVSKALSARVQDKSETAILKEALGTVERLVDFIRGMELVHMVFSDIDQRVEGQFVVTEMLLADAKPISSPTSLLQSSDRPHAFPSHLARRRTAGEERPVRLEGLISIKMETDCNLRSYVKGREVFLHNIKTLLQD